MRALRMPAGALVTMMTSPRSRAERSGSGTAKWSSSGSVATTMPRVSTLEATASGSRVAAAPWLGNPATVGRGSFGVRSGMITAPGAASRTRSSTSGAGRAIVSPAEGCELSNRAWSVRRYGTSSWTGARLLAYRVDPVTTTIATEQIAPITALDRTRLRARLRLAIRTTGTQAAPDPLELRDDPRRDRDRTHHHGKAAGDGDDRPERRAVRLPSTSRPRHRHGEQGAAGTDCRRAEHGEPARHVRQRPPACERLQGRHPRGRARRQPRRSCGHDGADGDDREQVGQPHDRSGDRAPREVLDVPIGHEAGAHDREHDARDRPDEAGQRALCDEEPLHRHRCARPRRSAARSSGAGAAPPPRTQP